MSLTNLALAVLRNYEAGMSGGDDKQFQALVELGDQAGAIAKLGDEVAILQAALCRATTALCDLHKGYPERELAASEGQGFDALAVELVAVLRSRGENDDHAWDTSATVDIPVANREELAASQNNPLSLLSEMQLMDELRSRGMVLSVWSEGDLSFLDDDDATAELEDTQLKELKSSVLEGAARGLEDILAARGNEHLSTWWSLNQEDQLQRYI